MTNFNDFAIQVMSMLSSLRLSMDPTSARRRLNSQELDNISVLVGDFEQIRFKFSAQSRDINRVSSQETLYSALDALRNNFDKLFSSPTNVELASRFAFRMQPSQRDQSTTLLLLDPSLRGPLTVLEAVETLRGIIDAILKTDNLKELLADLHKPEQLTFDQDDNKSTAIQKLKRLVPSQKVAPVQFKIEHEKISIEDTQSRALEADKKNIDTAKSEIINNGSKIIEQLKNSNCDRRLLDNIEQLQSQISGDANAVQIGISNISFSVMSGIFKQELPDAVSAMLQSHTLSIGMYVAQFPDWNKFSENANLANIDSNDAKIVDDNTKYILDYLDAHSEIVEPTVIKSLKQLRRVLQNPNQVSKRAIFAVIRTVENLLSKTFHYTIDFFEKTADEIKKTASKAAAVLIVTLAINTATKLTPIAEKIGELSWLRNAIEIVQKQMRSAK